MEDKIIREGEINMFQNVTDLLQKQRGSVDSQENGLPLTLVVPGVVEGTLVPASTVVSALLWQQYGLDLLHPEVSRWLEKNAPDVKYAVARKKFARGVNSNNANFRVGRNCTLKVYLTLEIDDRLRKVSSDYIWWQVKRSMEPENGKIKAMTELLNKYTGNKAADGYFAYQN